MRFTPGTAVVSRGVVHRLRPAALNAANPPHADRFLAPRGLASRSPWAATHRHLAPAARGARSRAPRGQTFHRPHHGRFRLSGLSIPARSPSAPCGAESRASTHPQPSALRAGSHACAALAVCRTLGGLALGRPGRHRQPQRRQTDLLDLHTCASGDTHAGQPCPGVSTRCCR